MPHRLARTAAGLPATFWWLFAGQGVMALATFVFPFLALFLAARGFSPEGTGLVVAMFGAGGLLAGPLAGALADRWGRRPTLLLGLVATGLLTALVPALRGPAALSAAVLALGVAAHLYFPPAHAIVADVVAPARYGDAFGLLYWERNAGIAVSYAAGGALASRGFAPLFLADAATTLLFALLAWRRIPETRPAAAADRPGGAADGRAPGFGAALADPSLMALLGLNVLFLLVMFQFMVALPLAMAARGFSPAAFGGAMAANGVVIVLLQPLAGRLTQGRDEGKVLALAAALVGLGTGAYALCATSWQFTAATALWSLGEILAVPTLSAAVSRLAPEALRGRYQGLLGVSFGAGLALAPAAGGVAIGRLGDRGLWAAAAAIGFAAAAGHLWAGRVRSRKTGVIADAPAAAAAPETPTPRNP